MGFLDQKGLTVRPAPSRFISIDGVDHTHCFEELAHKIAEWFFYGRHLADYEDSQRKREANEFFDLLKERVVELSEEYKIKRREN